MIESSWRTGGKGTEKRTVIYRESIVVGSTPIFKVSRTEFKSHGKSHGRERVYVDQ